MNDLLKKINQNMHEGRCPTAGCIGECACLDQNAEGWWWAALYIWDKEFNDSARVAKWFHDAGAEGVVVSHVLHDSDNGDRDGKCHDGCRAWWVHFSMPSNVQIEPTARLFAQVGSNAGLGLGGPERKRI